MIISEIQSQILANNREATDLQKRLLEIHKKNSSLSQLKESKLLEIFTDYIEIGSTYNFSNYSYLTGVQTGVKIPICKPDFVSGDSIEFVKKNSKSIVVKCITKVVSKIDIHSGIRTKNITHPDLLFRIDIMSLYHHMMRSTEFKAGFDIYVKRTESLESLGI